jgi:hypothetical protein
VDAAQIAGAVIKQCNHLRQCKRKPVTMELMAK